MPLSHFTTEAPGKMFMLLGITVVKFLMNVENVLYYWVWEMYNAEYFIQLSDVRRRNEVKMHVRKRSGKIKKKKN